MKRNRRKVLILSLITGKKHSVMKILVIDYLSYPNHRNFNKIHIESLLKQGHCLHLVGERSQFDDFKIAKNVSISALPDFCYRHFPIPPVSVRVQSIFSLFWIRRNISLERFDAVLFLTYDVVSVWTYKFKLPTILINHNNVGQLDNKVKFYITKQLSGKVIHVALNFEMANRLSELMPEKRVYYVPHGVMCPLKDLMRPDFIHKTEHYFFCPINRNCDEQFISDILMSEKVSEFLDENDINIYVKSKLLNAINNSHIRPVDNTLSTPEYSYMVKNAIGVILPYSSAFKYRCSGIFFECVSYGTQVIVSDINAFKEYQVGNHICVYSNVESFVDSLQKCSDGTLELFDSDRFDVDGPWHRLLSQLKVMD